MTSLLPKKRHRSKWKDVYIRSVTVSTELESHTSHPQYLSSQEPPWRKRYTTVSLTHLYDRFFHQVRDPRNDLLTIDYSRDHLTKVLPVNSHLYSYTYDLTDLIMHSPLLRLNTTKRSRPVTLVRPSKEMCGGTLCL